MNVIKYLSFASLFFLSFKSSSQNVRFVTQGTIEYEKRVNAYALIKQQLKLWDDDSFSASAFESYQKNNPQFKVAKSKLIFSNQTTAFIPEEDAVAPSNSWFSNMIEFKQANHVLSNLATGTSKIAKKVYEETYLVSDSIRKINWKITDEFRNIAG